MNLLFLIPIISAKGPAAVVSTFTGPLYFKALDISVKMKALDISVKFSNKLPS